MHLRERPGFVKQKLKQMEREDMQEAPNAERIYDSVRKQWREAAQHCHPLYPLLLPLVLLLAGPPPCPNILYVPCFVFG